jgi:hypothetical protein
MSVAAGGSENAFNTRKSRSEGVHVMAVAFLSLISCFYDLSSALGPVIIARAQRLS